MRDYLGPAGSMRDGPSSTRPMGGRSHRGGQPYHALRRVVATAVACTACVQLGCCCLGQWCQRGRPASLRGGCGVRETVLRAGSRGIAQAAFCNKPRARIWRAEGARISTGRHAGLAQLPSSDSPQEGARRSGPIIAGQRAGLRLGRLLNGCGLQVAGCMASGKSHGHGHGPPPPGVSSGRPLRCLLSAHSHAFAGLVHPPPPNPIKSRPFPRKPRPGFRCKEIARLLGPTRPLRDAQRPLSMAGFAGPDTILATQTRHRPATAGATTSATTVTQRTPSSSRQSLPNGPCNFRDAAVGTCGCDQFWDKCSAELHDESSQHRPGSARSTWCVCGHHACFHLRVSRASEQPPPLVTAPTPPVHAQCDEQCQLLPGALCHTHTGWRQLETGLAPAGLQPTQTGHVHMSHASPTQQPSYQSALQADGLSRFKQGRDFPSQTSTTGLPRIPSVCMLSHEQRPATDNGVRRDVNQSRQGVAGLGLSMMHLESMGTTNRLQSPTPTIPDNFGVTRALQRTQSEPELPTTRANSTEANTVASPGHGILGEVFEFNRNLQLNVPGDTVPDTYNPDDYIQSATEVATPSVKNTPDLGAADQAVQEGKLFIDTLARLTSDIVQPDGSPDKSTETTTVPTLLLTNSPSLAQEQHLQHILRTATPQGLQKLVSYLAPLHNLLSSIPNVAKTMQDLGSRLDMLESGSFNYVQPEDLNQTLEMYEGRLIEVEHRMDEHEKYHQAIDAEQSVSSYDRRHPNNLTASFASNQSIDSATSSALILAAMDRKDTEIEIDTIKDRLDLLEAAALPTSLHPWEIEVVLLPWGPELRGIWFAPDEPMHGPSDTTTQSSEEWTQARHAKLGQNLRTGEASARDTDSSPYPSAQASLKSSVLGSSENGWDSQAISDWAAGYEDDWLFPKACASKNLVYQRLQSRGFVKKVTLSGVSAKDIQTSLAYAFAEVSEHVAYDDSKANPMIAEYPGLRASYIPLRKLMKQSRLEYLTPAEMATSALWSAQFLASGVLMRVSGGKKRLYITTREAYTQQGDFMVREQSWPELRQLPRLQADQDSQMEGNDEHCQPQVPEADAKELCWQFVEAIDAPPVSVHSSFGSNQSVQLSMRPSDRRWRRSITPSSILKNRQVQPISPLSEIHPRRLGPRLHRTASASAVETFPPGSSKRRFNSSPTKQSSAPQPTSRAPSISITRMKRRRVATSSSPRGEENAPAETEVTVWNPTPRRSREPPSPFYSSQIVLPRSVSDVTSRPSQRSVAVTGKSTPFAYATPHSGPFVGGPGFGGYDKGGDTEPDDDDNDAAHDGDDGEQSWRGVTDGDEDSVLGSSSDAIAGAEEPGSFSADDSGFGSESGDDNDSDDDAFGAQIQQAIDEDSTDNDDDVLDSLLDILED
ncbi:hypothetical protein T440DRAFT_505605 [Plenodomus tracheiphilus IPT5]|uniref:Uncharacterized protein n=1 Tax=Plenodomus tracheiphilus IPT5 TaxID=1408161 RepID=A0A6A7BHG3_9PLEO|nr:hypothetical protein T440DRAFT_505605 [Plenodomus tracheiphilus IPT5]